MKTDTKKTVLKPCPFCGQKAKRSRITDHGPELPKPFWSVSCSNHYCSIPCASGDTRAEADKAWNRRRCELNMHPITGTESVPFVGVCGSLMMHVFAIEPLGGSSIVIMRGVVLEGFHFNDSGNYGPGEEVTVGPITDNWRRISTEA